MRNWIISAFLSVVVGRQWQALYREYVPPLAASVRSEVQDSSETDASPMPSEAPSETPTSSPSPSGHPYADIDEDGVRYILNDWFYTAVRMMKFSGRNARGYATIWSAPESADDLLLVQVIVEDFGSWGHYYGDWLCELEFELTGYFKANLVRASRLQKVYPIGSDPETTASPETTLAPVSTASPESFPAAVDATVDMERVRFGRRSDVPGDYSDIRLDEVRYITNSWMNTIKKDLLDGPGYWNGKRLYLNAYSGPQTSEEFLRVELLGYEWDGPDGTHGKLDLRSVVKFQLYSYSYGLYQGIESREYLGTTTTTTTPTTTTTTTTTTPIPTTPVPVPTSPPAECVGGWKIFYGFDIPGHDIAQSAAANFGACFYFCDQKEGCTAFTYTQEYGGRCYLKGSTASEEGLLLIQKLSSAIRC